MKEQDKYQHCIITEYSNSPSDWEYPKWEEYDKVHGWRNYITRDVAVAWPSFPAELKRMLAAQAQELAGREEWD